GFVGDIACCCWVKLLAVLPFAMAIERLPGQASGSLRMTEQRLPSRSTMADHIRLGLNKPPFASGEFTTVASLACKVFTTFGAMAHSSSARAGAENARLMAAAIKDCLIKTSPFDNYLR